MITVYIKAFGVVSRRESFREWRMVMARITELSLSSGVPCYVTNHVPSSDSRFGIYFVVTQ